MNQSPKDRRAAQRRVADEAFTTGATAAVAGVRTPAELVALAAERDHLADQMDAQAAVLDERATMRDLAAEARDARATARTRRAAEVTRDLDPGFLDRCAAALDRDDAAGDRSDSRADRESASESRRRAANHRRRAADERAPLRAAVAPPTVEQLDAALATRMVIGQAAGLLMARHRLTTDAAHRVLEALAESADETTGDVATRLVSLPRRRCAGVW